MIELHEVAVAYGNERVLNGVSFLVERGAFVGLVGANGSGKTTLLKVMARLHVPVAGEVRIDGRDIASWPRRALARVVAGVWQRPPLAFACTARQIVLLGRTPYLSPLRFGTSRDQAVVDAAMEQTDTARLASRDVSTLSGGELQRVFIAAALAQQSRVLLLDEPTTFLDFGQAASLSALLRKLHRSGITIVCASHDLALLRRHATGVVLLTGKDATPATPDALTPATLTRAFGAQLEDWYG